MRPVIFTAGGDLWEGWESRELWERFDGTRGQIGGPCERVPQSLRCPTLNGGGGESICPYIDTFSRVPMVVHPSLRQPGPAARAETGGDTGRPGRTW